MTRTRWEILALTAVLLVAACLRLYRLSNVPPGVTHDEADTGYFASAVYRGEPAQVETPYGYANEKFSLYSGALFMALAGPTDLALRLHSAFFGLLMLVFAHLWLRSAFDPTVALGTTALTAVSFWPVATARFALNPQPAPALFAGAVWLLWSAWFARREGWGRWWTAALAGLFLAGSLWAYEVARATVAAIFVLPAWLLMVNPAQLRRGGPAILGALALGAGLAAPHLLDPAAWQRSATLATTWRDLLSGDPGPLLAATWEGLGILFVRGDPFVTYNLPGLPLMNPLLGVLFVGGLVLCLRRRRQPAAAFALLWLAFGLGPVILVGAYTSTLHAMGIQPIVYFFPALAAVEGGRWLARRYGARFGRAAGVLLAVLVIVVALFTYRDYFLRWARSAETGAAYFDDLAAATDHVQACAPAGVVVISSPYPDLPHDPFVADLRIQRDDVALRWADGRAGLIYPPAGDSSDQLLLVLDRAPLAAELCASDLEPIHHAEDFGVYRWDPDECWTALQQGGVFRSWAVDFGGAISLAGSRFLMQAVPGETVTVTTLWHVIDPAAVGPVADTAYGQQAAIFVHLVDAEGHIVAQDDGLAVPAWDWQPGDRFAQLHRVSLPADLAAGAYRLKTGVYRLPDMVRLRLPTGADNWELGLVEVGG